MLLSSLGGVGTHVKNGSKNLNAALMDQIVRHASPQHIYSPCCSALFWLLDIDDVYIMQSPVISAIIFHRS